MHPVTDCCAAGLPPGATEVCACACAGHQRVLLGCLHRRCRGLREGHHHGRGELRPVPEHPGLSRAMDRRPHAPVRMLPSLTACLCECASGAGLMQWEAAAEARACCRLPGSSAWRKHAWATGELAAASHAVTLGLCSLQHVVAGSGVGLVSIACGLELARRKPGIAACACTLAQAEFFCVCIKFY